MYQADDELLTHGEVALDDLSEVELEKVQDLKYYISAPHLEKFLASFNGNLMPGDDSEKDTLKDTFANSLIILWLETLHMVFRENMFDAEASHRKSDSEPSVLVLVLDKWLWPTQLSFANVRSGYLDVSSFGFYRFWRRFGKRVRESIGSNGFDVLRGLRIYPIAGGYVLARAV